jgi:hypothetical protein
MIRSRIIDKKHAKFFRGPGGYYGAHRPRGKFSNAQCTPAAFDQHKTVLACHRAGIASRLSPPRDRRHLDRTTSRRARNLPRGWSCFNEFRSSLAGTSESVSSKTPLRFCFCLEGRLLCRCQSHAARALTRCRRAHLRKSYSRSKYLASVLMIAGCGRSSSCCAGVN